MAKKILLADDSITIQKVIELTFSDEDFDVVTVGNGRLALERLAEVRPDIVLCDIIMPEKDGYEVCEQIKSSPSTGHIPVLLLTGAFEPFDQERAARAGYDGSLAKPFEPETLIAKVKELLAKAPRPLAPPPLPATGPMPAAQPQPSLARTVSPPPVAPAPVAPAVAAAPSFIPDEPFSGLDEGAFEVEPAPTPRTAVAPAPPLAPISAEESDTLSVPPEQVAEDNAATVMYHSAQMPWQGGAPAPAAAPAPAVAAAPEPVAAAGTEAPVFEAVLEEDLDFGPGDYASGPRAAGGVDISEAFSANAGTLPPVAEVEEGTSGPFAALVRGGAEPIEKAAASTAEFPRATAVEEELLEPEPFAPAEPPQRPIFEEAEPEPVRPATPPPLEAPRARPLLEPAPAAVAPPHPPVPRPPEPAPAPVRSLLEPTPKAAAPVPAAPPRVPTRPTELPPVRPAVVAEAPKPPERPRSLLDAVPARPEPPARVELRPKPEVHTAPAPGPVPVVPATAPAPVAPVAEASFRDVAAPVAEPVRPSEAAGVSVPADMVEKIAQRVIAQISEKIVREVAWEVIPDLAEALIKREIERLKAELAKI